MDTTHRGHGVVLSDADRDLIDRALAFYMDGPGDEGDCEELRNYLYHAW